MPSAAWGGLGLGPAADREAMPFAAWGGLGLGPAADREAMPFAAWGRLGLGPAADREAMPFAAWGRLGLGPAADREAVPSVAWGGLGLGPAVDREAMPFAAWGRLGLGPVESSEATITALLRHRGHGETADRIQLFFDIRAQEPNEPPIVIESLRSLVTFIIQEPKLSVPIIGSDPQGLMELEWHLRDNGNPNSLWGRGNGVVSMKFLKSGTIQFVALSGPYRRGLARKREQGESTRENMMASLGDFALRITRS